MTKMLRPYNMDFMMGCMVDYGLRLFMEIMDYKSGNVFMSDLQSLPMKINRIPVFSISLN